MWPDFIRGLPGFFWGTWLLWNRDLPFVASIVLAFLVLASLALHNRLTTYRIPIIFAIVIWSLLILMAQRVHPPARVWLFLLPIYLILASSVISWLWQQVTLRYNIDSARVFLTLVATVSLLLSFNVIHTASIRDSIETGNLKPAEEIALFLKDNLQNTDIVLYDSPSEYSLKYYFRQHHIPETYLIHDSNTEAQRVLVVVNQLHGYTLERVIEENQLSDAISLESAKIIRQYEGASLYEIDQIE